MICNKAASGNKWLFIMLGGFLLLFGACQPVENAPEKEDKILARAYNKTLYYSDVKDLIPKNSEPEDSSLRVNAFIERWVREALLMTEAEKNIPKDLNIDQLVRDYRSSLILTNYEKLLVETLLDSIVTKEELQTYYDQNKDQYLLDGPIARAHFIQFPLNYLDVKNINKWWNSEKEEDLQSLTNLCASNANAYLLEDSTWFKVDRLIELFPPGVLSKKNISSGKQFYHQDDVFFYKLRIMEIISEQSIPPFSHVADQMKKVILHKRKIKILEDKKEELYNKELRRNNVRIY